MIDEKIIIDISKLPNLLIKCIEKLELYNRNKDEEMYMATLELLETTAKSYIIENKLSEKDYKDILKKYGGEI